MCVHVFDVLTDILLLCFRHVHVSDSVPEEASMAAWVVRGGSRGEREPEALDNGIITIGFRLMGDLSGVSGREGFTEFLRNIRPDDSPHQVRNAGRQAWFFVELIQPGDLAVMPRKGTGFVAVGTFLGDYLYRSDAGDFAHGRRVSWINTEVRRDELGDDLKRSLSADSTVYRPRAEGSEERLRALAEGSGSNGTSVATGNLIQDVESTEDEPALDIGEYALGQVREYVERNFHGHALGDLVAAVLKAEGYRVTVSPPGPDGGVDILAGKGPLGFDSPRICVQVKSGRQVSGVNVLRELQGVMQTFQADHGLLVSWGGFARPAEQEAKAMHFNVRLWGADQLLEAVLENYELLSADVKAELPLKRFWALVQEDAG